MSAEALGLVLLSAAIHAAWNLLIKTSAHPRAFVVIRAVIVIPMLAAALPFFHIADIPVGVWVVLVCSSLIHACYFFGLASGYSAGDISLVYPIARSAPAFVPLCAMLLFGERVSVGGGAGIAVVVAAMWLIHTGGRPHLRALMAPGVGYAYFTLGTVVAYSLLDKYGMAQFAAAPWSGPLPRALAFLLLEQALAGLVYVAVIGPRLPRTLVAQAARDEWGRVLLCAVLDTASYALILYVYQTAPVSYVVAVRQTSVIVAVLLGAGVLKEPLGRARLVGAVAIVAGVYLIARFA